MRMLMRISKSGRSRATPVFALLVAVLILAAPAAWAEPVRVHLAVALPNSGHVGSLVQVSGRVLELRRARESRLNAGPPTAGGM